MKKVLFLLAFPLLFTFCKKENIVAPSVTMIYQMTQCDDPWQKEPGYFNDKVATFTNFFKKKDIIIVTATIKTDCSKMAVCAACSCLGCDQVTVTVNPKDVAAMEKFKFVKQ